MADTEVPEARPGELTFSLTWLAEDGALRGVLEARNSSEHRVRLSGKPRLIPLGDGARALDTPTVVTAELLLPGYVELDPGESAVSKVGWAGWDGPAASGVVVVEWPGGQAEVPVTGPPQPVATGPSTNLWSSWFVRVDT